MEAKINAGNKTTRTGHTELYITKKSLKPAEHFIRMYSFVVFKERDTKIPHIFNCFQVWEPFYQEYAIRYLYKEYAI